MNPNTETFKQILDVNRSSKNEMLAMSQLKSIKIQLEEICKGIPNTVDVKYTSFYILLRKTETGGWECINIVDSKTFDSVDFPEDGWDLVLPIPDPQTVPEFDGW